MHIVNARSTSPSNLLSRRVAALGLDLGVTAHRPNPEC